LQDIKQLLKYHQIKYAQLPAVYKHQIRIEFNNAVSKEYAEQIFSSTTFHERSGLKSRQQHQ